MAHADHQPRISTDLHGPSESDSRWIHETLCQDCKRCDRETRILPADLEDFVVGVLAQHGVDEAKGRSVGRVLVASDQRGIPSHGVARLGRYLTGIAKGFILPEVDPEVLEPAPALAVVDARNGLGQVAGELGMALAIRKAKEQGIGAVTVKNSNHYGIAGYYALQAVSEGLIGLSLTNSAPLVVPTHGAEVMLGTNPIAFGAPAARHPAFLLDMATSVVPRGKVEVYDRNRMQMPKGWTVDENGYDATNPGTVLRNLLGRIGGGILPLGGRGEDFSGYKGYGLAFLVDILSGVLSGAAFGPGVDDVHRKPDPESGVVFPNVGHFFLTIDIARFMPLGEFEARLDAMIDQIKGSKKALDQEVIFVHGEKEFAKAEAHAQDGIPIARNVFDTLLKIAADCGAPAPRCVGRAQAARAEVEA